MFRRLLPRFCVTREVLGIAKAEAAKAEAAAASEYERDRDADGNSYDDALALKDFCCRVINQCNVRTADADTKKKLLEVYLLRANAYKALGLPFFAAADLLLVEQEHMPWEARHVLGGVTQHDVGDAIGDLPPECQYCVPGDTARLQADALQSCLGESFALNEQVGHEQGRGIVATAHVGRKEVVMRKQRPFASYSLKDTRCANCMGPVPGNHGVACSNDNCHEEYCSRECRSIAEKTYHGPEICFNAQFQSLELQQFSRFAQATPGGKDPDANTANYSALNLMTLRLCAMAVTQQLRSPSEIPAVAVLAGRFDFSPRSITNETMMYYKAIIRSMPHIHTMSYEEFIGICSKVQMNAFRDDNGISMYLERSFFNHSCDPNMAVSPDGDFVTIRNVRKGEQAVFNYYPALQNLDYIERKRQLEKRGLVCTCARCRKQL